MDRVAVERFRLALFGRMVMGVSHEVDNQLSVVLGFSELIRMPGEVGNRTTEHAGRIFAAGDRIAAIVKQFSHHVRPHPPADETFSVSGLLPELLLFARFDLCRGNVSLRIPEDLPEAQVRGDARDFGLVLLAILLNGAESMADSGGGDLSLSVTAGGESVEVSVTDDGPGIPETLLPRVFEEGFTTKQPELHAGMGLPVARHILERFGGTIRVENRSAGGCASVIRLPAS